MDDPCLDKLRAPKQRWHDPSAVAKGISTAYRWTGPGSYGLEVVCGSAQARPSTTIIREIWKQRHGRGAAPLLAVFSYQGPRTRRALVCGPAGEVPPVVDLDYAHAERLAAAVLTEPNRHSAIRFLSSALEGDPSDQPGLRNKGLLATHELLRGVPERSDWEDATARSRDVLRERGQDLVRGLGYELLEELHSFVGEGWEQEDDIILLTLRRSATPS